MSTGLSRNELIRLSYASKWYDKSCVFDDVSLSVAEGERITIVGENGTGKSTLLKMLVGQTDLSGGEILRREGMSIGYLPQDPLVDRNKSMLEFVTEGLPGLNELSKKFISKQEYLKNASDDQETSTEVELIRSEFNKEGGYRIGKILSGLRIAHIPWERRLSETSGGEQTRFSLAKLLLQEPDLLVLDEPTNHLDVAALEWLEKYLDKVESSIVLVTHDRMLLSNITRHIVEIDNKTKQLISFRGRYDAFLNEKRRKQEQALQEYYNLKKEEQVLRQDVAKHQHKLTIKPPMRDNNKAGYKARGERSQRNTGRNIRERASRLEEIDELTSTKLEKIKEFTWTLQSKNHTSLHQPVCTFNNIKKTIEGKEILIDCTGTIYSGQKVILQGLNGSGKTTLLRILMNEIQPDGGAVSFFPSVKIGYLPQFHNVLNPNNIVLNEIRKGTNLSEKESLSMLHKYCLFEPEYAYKQIGQLSIGRQRRLQLATILLKNPDFLILDEPTNHLDYMSCEYLESQLSSFNGTILAVSHDRCFIHKLNADIWQINNGNIKQLESKNKLRQDIRP